MAETMIIEMLAGLAALGTAIAGVLHTRNQMKQNWSGGARSNDHRDDFFRSRVV